MKISNKIIEEETDNIEIRKLLKNNYVPQLKVIDIPKMERMSYADAAYYYGSDKPDIRFEMKFNYLKETNKTPLFNEGFPVFDSAESVIAITAKGANTFTRKQIDELTEWVKRPQVGAKGLAYVRCNEDGTFKSSLDKFYDEATQKTWAAHCNAEAGDLIFILSGTLDSTRKQMNDLRLHLGDILGLRDPNNYRCHWVVDFPLLEWNEEAGRYFAMHHPFTSPKPEDIALLSTHPGEVRANAYDMVINGVEVGGGSIRIHDRDVQAEMFKLLGFSDEEAKEQFGFLLNAFEYGAPPHGGIAFGFDRLCSLFGGESSIRDYIAFPKNNSGRDVMIDAPSAIHQKQLDELALALNLKA